MNAGYEEYQAIRNGHSVLKENKTMTNREWLESLSDEELANKTWRPCWTCIYKEKCNNCCTNGRIKWLQAEHKDADKQSK